MAALALVFPVPVTRKKKSTGRKSTAQPKTPAPRSPVSLSSLERNVLRALFESAKRRRHKFGVIEEASAVCKPHELVVAITYLQRKGILVHEGPIEADGETLSRFTWAMPVPEVRKLIQ